jgi:ribosomal protein S18 acetylase RimI-like enzyme
MPEKFENPAADTRSTERCVFRSNAGSDESAIREIFREANLSPHALNQSDSSASATAGSNSIYLCALDNQVVAVLQWRDLGEEAEILDLAVPIRYRRKGYARSLMTDFLGMASEHGVRDVFLEVRESNGAARALYCQLGFELSGRRPNYYRDPAEAALLLHLKLTD